jgi:DNA-binding LacI/PurR family transcriptional regulator
LRSRDFSNSPKRQRLKVKIVGRNVCSRLQLIHQKKGTTVSITIEDVAKHAGVSDATVSRVLSNKPHVRDEVRTRVLASVAELGYQPSRVARSLRTLRSKTIGVIISDIQNPFFTALVRAVEDIANANQHAIFLCNTDENIEKEKVYIDMMQAEHVAGVLITPTRESGGWTHRLVEANIPVVVVDRYLSDVDVDTVVVDNVRGAYTLVQHLIDKGYRRIGAVIGSPAITTGRERMEGYLQALAKNGLPVIPDLIQANTPNQEWGYQLTEALLKLPEPPTAIFTGNVLLTIGALRVINDLGLVIPRDVALAAFDEAAWSSLMCPSLTTVEQPTYELGKVAAELLLKRMQDNTRLRQKIMLQTKLHIRQSSNTALVGSGDLP